jgi:hypothetical protein
MEMSIKKSESLDKLGFALVKAQGDMIDPVKDAKGYGYKYAKLDQIIKLIRPTLTKHGLSYTIFPGQYYEDKQSLTGILLHESGQFIEGTIQLPVERSKGMSLLQSIGSAITYGRRYLLSSVAGIQADDDIDGHVDAEEQSLKMAKPSASAPTLDQVNKLKEQLLSLVEAKGIPESEVNKWKTKANVRTLSDLPAEKMSALIEMLKKKG